VPALESPRPETPAPAAETVRPATPVAAVPATSGGDVVDSFLQSGRPLPSYITGSDAQPAAPASAATAQPAPAPATPAPAQPVAETPQAVATPAATPVAEPPVAVADPVAVSAIPVAPIPMPLSMRPRPVSAPIAEATAPVVVSPDIVGPVELTAADLEDWESGPLSEFLANRQRQQGGGLSDYDPNGFYLDQGPNPGRDRVIGREAPIYFGN
jgi:hypothetical protein